MLSASDVLKAYQDALLNRAGDIVLNDLKQAYIYRQNETLEQIMKEYPHPYRAYVEIGQRMVVQALLSAIEVKLLNEVDNHE